MLNPKNLRVGDLFTVNDSRSGKTGYVFRLVSKANNLFYVDNFDRFKREWRAYHHPVNVYEYKHYDKDNHDLILVRLSKNVLKCPK